MNFIYPTQPDTKIVDLDYKNEYEYIKSHPEHKALLVDIDMKKVITNNEGPCIYRGWMLSPEDYSWLSSKYKLKTSTPEYFQSHYLPNWYYKIEPLTFETKIYPDVDFMMKSIDEINEKYLLKNYVKSFTTKNGAAFIESKEEAKSIIESDVYNEHPGVVLRKYEELDESTEKRLFIYKNIIGNRMGEVPEFVTEAVEVINNKNLYTIDIVKNKKGEWRIVEIGDGQVSSLKEWSPEEFYKLFELLGD